jgi:hypothetical protein
MQMKISIVLAVAVSTVLLASCAPKPPAAQSTAVPENENLATTRQVMLGLTIPASDVLFQIAEHPPADEAAWDRIVANAVMLAEAGNMLLTGARDMKQAEWSQHAHDLVARSRVAADAAMKHDVDAVLEAGNGIYEVCEACHAKFMPARVAEQAGAVPKP